MVVSDEPYSPLIYDGRTAPEISQLIAHVVVAWSWSKAMAISGERIGYLAIPRHLPEATALANACTFANRALGYSNAPAIWQLVVAQAPEATVDVTLYQEKRDLLCSALNALGYEAPPPQGSFYVFPKTPVPGDVAFILSAFCRPKAFSRFPVRDSDEPVICGFHSQSRAKRSKDHWQVLKGQLRKAR